VCLAGARIAPLAAVFGVNGALYGSLLPRYPQIADQVRAFAGQFGLVLAGVGVGGVTGAFVATWLVRALGGPVRALAVSGTAFLAAGVAVAGAPSLTLLAVAFAALGLFDGFVDTAMNQAGSALRIGGGVSVMGRLHATLAAATLAGAVVGAGAAGTVGVLTHLLVVAAALLVVLAWALRALAAGDRARAGAAARLTPHQDVAYPAASGVGRLRRAGWSVVVAVAGLTAVLVELPAQEWSGLLLARELSASPTVAASGPLVAVAGVLLGRLCLERAVDVAGWLLVARLAGGLTATGTLAAVVLGALTREPAAVLVGLGVAAIGAGVAAPLMFDRASHLAAHVGLPPDAGPGLVSGVFRLGVLVSPLLVGGIAERTDLFVALGAAALAGVLLSFSPARSPPRLPPVTNGSRCRRSEGPVPGWRPRRDRKRTVLRRRD